ncbi:hypothetical protein [Pelomonas sp. Root1444]|uniref:hypothetical protein n=1 Tax=Pelomonas sp. Root1444 TaxID=1736464 RepID=UPI000B27EC9B|nr:hypothetical protein [Pelomonas sp. Root1444]
MNAMPLVGRYATDLTDDDIDRAVNIAPVRIELHGNDANRLADLLDGTLRRIFKADRQVRSIIRYLLSAARAHAEIHLATEKAYLAGLYGRHPWGHVMTPAICLTGLGGVGKSDLFHALARLLGPAIAFAVAGHSNLKSSPLWQLNASEGLGINALLRPHVIHEGGVNDAAVISAKDMRSPRLVHLASRTSWRDGACLMVADELQHVSFGADSNAQVTALLIKLLQIGPRVAFGANFSLLHKLLRRKQEDHQRLLTRPLLMEPMSVDDEDFSAYVRVVIGVAPEFLVFDPRQHQEQLHLYTFGIKRLVVELVVLAFRLARSKNRKATVGGQELLAAYRHFDYSANREAVELLHRQAIQKQMLREDLWCPLAGVEPITQSPSNVVDADAAIQHFERRVEEALLDAALGPKAKGESPQETRVRKRSTAVVTPIRAGKATKEDLIAGANAWNDL